MNLDKLKSDLERDEKRMRTLYADSVGKWTIGIGHNISDNGLSDAAIDFIFTEDRDAHIADMDAHLAWWKNLDEVRQRALCNMCFNLGINRLLGFRNMLVALQNGNWIEAAAQAKDSVWYKQVGIRAERIIHMFETGTDP